MSSKIIFQTSSGWRLEKIERQRPDGQRDTTAVVRHPGAVALIPVTDAGEVLLIHQYRLAFDQTIVEIPAGTRGWDEDWLLCAQRELREESGFRASNFVDLGEIWPAPGVSDERIRLYLATGLTPDPLPQDFDEEIEVVAVPLAEAVGMAVDGRIADAKSVAALVRANHFLNP